jgi:hypothetical protein
MIFIMTTFKKARTQLIDSYLNDIIDDEEFVLLYDAHFSKNPEFPYKEYEIFDMDEIDNVQFEAEFRFRKEDIPTHWLKYWPHQIRLFVLKARRQMVLKACVAF